MILSVKSEDISKGIKTCFSALEPREVSAGIQFEAEGDLLSLKASNTVYSVIFSCNADVEEPGKATVEGKMAYSVISKASGICSFTSNEKNLIVKAGGRTTLPNMARNVPIIQEANGQTITCDSVEFKNAVNKVRYAISEDQSRVILTGAHLVTDGSFATITALDGFRLAQTQFACEGDSIDIVIPSRILSAILEPITTGKLTISTNNARITVSYANYVFHSILVAGKYIDTENIIPKDFSTTVLAKTADMKSMLESASIACGKNNLVELQISEDKISFAGKSEEAEFVGEIDAMVNGNDISIAFNSKYLANALSRIGTEQCEIRLNSSVHPAIFTPHKDGTYPDINLVLPVRKF